MHQGIKNLNLVGYMEAGRYARVWNPKENAWTGDPVLLMDRIMGYDSSEGSGSPYGIGGMDDSLIEISKKRAMELIRKLD